MMTPHSVTPPPPIRHLYPPGPSTPHPKLNLPTYDAPTVNAETPAHTLTHLNSNENYTRPHPTCKPETLTPNPTPTPAYTTPETALAIATHHALEIARHPALAICLLARASIPHQTLATFYTPMTPRSVTPSPSHQLPIIHHATYHHATYLDAT